MNGDSEVVASDSTEPYPPKLKINKIGLTNVTLSSSEEQMDLYEGLNPTLIPLSPSSKYSVSQLLPDENNLIDAVLFSYWDNILGPRIEHVWFNGRTLLLGPQFLLQICKQTLAGELCWNLSNGYTDWRLHTIPDKGLVAIVFIFSAQGMVGLSLHSLTLIIPQKDLHKSLQFHDVIHSWMTRLIGKFRVLLNKGSNSEGVTYFSTYLMNFMEMLLSLDEARLPEDIKVSDSILSPANNIEEDFLRTAIASHLMTFHRSVVVGKSIKRINLVINALALFNNAQERRCSRGVVMEKNWAYHHDLYLQGLVQESGNSFFQQMKEILCSMYPTTIIDLNMHRVMHSPFCHDHIAWRHEKLEAELLCLYYDHSEDEFMPGRVEKLFPKSEYAESFVRILLKELRQLPPYSPCGLYGLWEAHIASFMRVLYRKALCLVKHVEAETNQGMDPLRGGPKRLQEDLSLSYEGDFRIVLSMAEKIKPKIYDFVMSGGKPEAGQFYSSREDR